MMLNPNEWSKGSHFIRCYLKPKASMAETQVIEAPWLMAPPQTSMAEPSRAHPPPVLVFFSSSAFIFGLFFCVWLKKLYICLVGCGFENLIFCLRI